MVVLSCYTALPCLVWVRLCVPRSGPGDVERGFSPRLLAAWLAGREYKSMAWGLGREVRMSEQPVERLRLCPGVEQGLGAALALQASGSASLA